MEVTMEIKVQAWGQRALSTALLFLLCLAAACVHAQSPLPGEGRPPQRPVLSPAPDFTQPTL
jgi:hypothetical protein